MTLRSAYDLHLFSTTPHMADNNSSSQEEKVLLTLELPLSLVEWIDQLKDQLGIMSRGLVVTELLRELHPDAVEISE
jgi:hypothetical protein